jgi:ADP-ribosylglycohydrolase
MTTAAAVLGQITGDPARRALLILMAYAAGDSFGVGYEFEPLPLNVTIDRLSNRPDDADWPRGGVSDDTHLTLLTLDSLAHSKPSEAAAGFLASLRAELPRLRGLGPTTRAALGLEVPERERGLIGSSNGGMMRAALVGLAYPSSASAQRREMVSALVRATHSSSGAVDCAVLVSAAFSNAFENGDTLPVRSAIAREAEELGRQDLSTSLDSWIPDAGGVSLDPLDTLGAVLRVVDSTQDVAEAYRLACELGGDTDTVAALAGSLVLARGAAEASLTSIPWLDDVLWSEIPDIVRVAELVAERRAQA